VAARRAWSSTSWRRAWRDESDVVSARATGRVSHALRWRIAALRDRAANKLPRFFPVLREVKAATQRNRVRVALDLVTAWLKYGINPENFAATLLWDVPRERWRDFVVGEELNSFLNSTLDVNDRLLSRDKAEIAARDGLRGLPWLPTLAVIKRRTGVAIDSARTVDRQEALWPTLRELGRDRDLVLKPACGRQGDGFFHVSAKGAVRDGDGIELSPDELGRAVFSYTHPLGDYGYIVQEALVANRQMIELTGIDALSSVRVVTALSDGIVDFIEVFLKIPAPGRLTDNFRYGAHGTMLASVDPGSGRLTALVGLLRPGSRYVLERTANHPRTGHEIEGRTLPHWGEAVEISRRAALAHPNTATVGWDLALTPSGWVLLDFNPIWGPTGGEACTREGIRPLLARRYPQNWR
jgi:hypothetical protein